MTQETASTIQFPLLQSGPFENAYTVEVERLRAENKALRSALEAIAWMQVKDNTDHAELSALCMSIANITLQGVKP